MSGPRAPEPGRVIAGKYRLDELLGQGGMGAVYAASHLVTGKRVAVKWMLAAGDDLEAAQRFIREARIAARVEHPNVVNVFDVGRDEDGSLFMVMELLKGTPLSARIGEQGMPIAELIDIAIEAMRGVQSLHDAGVVHRDLKPENVFCCTSGVCKVLDFGVGYLNADDAGGPLTRTGVVLGTPRYMSPEQIRGVKELDARSDVYALGVILYEGLTGHVPFDDETYAALAVRIVTDFPRAIRELRPEVPAQLAAIVERAMTKQPQDRFASMAELAAALEPFGSARRGPLALPATRERISLAPTLAASTPAPRNRPRWPFAALAVIAAAGLAIGGWYWSQTPSVPRPQPAASAPVLPPPPLAQVPAPPPRRDPVPTHEIVSTPPAPPARELRRPLRSTERAPAPVRRVPRVDEGEF